jgi:hypothetical protein
MNFSAYVANTSVQAASQPATAAATATAAAVADNANKHKPVFDDIKIAANGKANGKLWRVTLVVKVTRLHMVTL